jgi:hypothetical protein
MAVNCKSEGPQKEFSLFLSLLKTRQTFNKKNGCKKKIPASTGFSLRVVEVNKRKTA